MESRIVMLGAAPETRGAIASVVDTYRAAGLFHRWPIGFIATHGDGAPLDRLAIWRKAAGALATELAGQRKLVVHLHSTPRRLWKDSVFLSAALLARAPLLLHLHGGGLENVYDRAGTPGRAILPFLLERAAVVGVNSEPLRSWVGKFTRHANVVMLPDPVAIPQSADGTVVPNLVLFLGRLDVQGQRAASGVLDLVEAVAAVRGNIPDVRLVCAGEGDRQAVERHAERLGIADAVKFTGWVGPSGKRALLESAAALALPSYQDGIPVSLLEAMAAGVPVIASRLGGVTEVVVDGLSGFLVAPGDKATLARTLRSVLLDRDLAARIGAAGRESVRRRHAPEKTLAVLEGIYRNLGVRDYPVEMREAA